MNRIIRSHTYYTSLLNAKGHDDGYFNPQMAEYSPCLGIFAPWKSAPAPTAVIRRHFAHDITAFWYKDIGPGDCDDADGDEESDRRDHLMMIAIPDDDEKDDDAKSTESTSTPLSVELVVNGHRAQREEAAPHREVHDEHHHKERESSVSLSKSYRSKHAKPFELHLNGGKKRGGTALTKLYSGLC